MPSVNISTKNTDKAYEQAMSVILNAVKNSDFLNQMLADRGVRSVTINVGTPFANANGFTNLVNRINDPLITLNKSLMLGQDGELARSMPGDEKDADGKPIFVEVKSVKSIIVHEYMHVLFPGLTRSMTKDYVVHNRSDDFPKDGIVTDLVGEVAFRALSISIREQVFGGIPSNDQEVLSFSQRLGELKARSDGASILSKLGFDFETASFETIRAALKDPTSQLSKNLSYGPLKNSPDVPSRVIMQKTYDIDGLSNIPECFVSGTPILMHDNAYRPIESIEPGDEVMAFSTADGGRGRYEKRRVTRVFRNVTRQIIDLRGLRCTLGHVFLTGETDRAGNGTFRKIADLLSEDGTLVDAGGSVVRARTGAVVGSLEDRPVKVVFEDASCGGESVVTVRAGIPVPGQPESDGQGGALGRPRRSLLQWLTAAGVTLLDNGELRTQAGDVFQMIDWPSHSTPFDEPEMQNWIVFGKNEDSYTPPWILGLSADSALQRHVV